MIIYDPSVLESSVGSLTKSSLGLNVNNKQAFDKIMNAIFRFSINPQNATFTKNKVQAVTLTKAGYELQYWRNQMIGIAYVGRSGAFQPPSQTLQNLGASVQDVKNLTAGALGNSLNDIRLSPAWLKFQRFQDFYDTASGDLMMVFDGVFYQGFFEDFSFSQDANNPFIINYNFKFSAYPDKVYNLFTKVPAVYTSIL
jgi:hypothetical protein